ncbi:MAG: MBOAT family protein [Myxococcales bacterium]|nr:MBOAT family protein [Myxococcales bacterium]
MLFPTFDFLLFAIPVLVGFWAIADRPVARVLFLTFASYFFYMAGPKTTPPPAPAYFAGLLVFSTVLDYVCGREIYKLEEDFKSEDEAVKARARRKRNLWLTASLVGNLGLLGYFKYANFFLQAFADIAGVLGLPFEAYHFKVILPLGISFYTFQSLSYTIDIWRGRMEPETSLRRFALFVAFFPQLVAGPIVRAKQFLPQLREGPRFTRENIETGAFRVCKGLVKKVVLGDFIAVHLTDRIFDNPDAFTSPELLIALYSYTLQIYADFSGYSDIAIGLGLMLGFRLPENFDRPYQSKDIAEYWRRWHMTLSSWLRDYLFFQLLARFGARGGYWALWLTMFLVGMWHGASWNFVIYANLHAGAMVFNRWRRLRRPSGSRAVQAVKWAVGLPLTAVIFTALGRFVLLLEWPQATGFGASVAALALLIVLLPVAGPKTGRWMAAVHIFLTFHLVVFSRIFFRATDLETARRFAAGLVRFDGRWIRPEFMGPWVWAALAFGLVYHFTPKEWVNKHALALFRRLPGVVLGLLFMAMAYGLMKVLEGAPRAFIYFQF